ncbi:MAG: DUF72 domain-containing protein [Treponema sp.]|nr:DUF72 domain-containing protein [Treponema sp.]
MENIRLGTCSWKYPSWAGLVYSSPEPASYLEEYARRYRTVEVDQWFWSLGKESAALPRREVVTEYDASTPPDFRFTVKCPNALTLTHHDARKGEAMRPNERFLDPELFLRFLDALSALVPKIGLFIFQFSYLNREKMPSKAAFFDQLGAFLETLPADLPYAVELRNPGWLDGGFFDFLAERGVAPAILQGYWMDDAAAKLDRFADKIGPRLCLRLHGEDREGMEERTGESWNKIIRPKDEELGRLAVSITRLFGKDIYINVNNHYEGSAPRTIEKLEALLRPEQE